MRSFHSIPAVAAILTFLMLAGCSSDSSKPRTFAMGERVQLGHIIYTVFETQWMTQIGSDVDAKVPRNRFLVVRLSASNSGAADVLAPGMTVVDDDGKAYPESPNGEGVPHWLGSLREVKPAEAAQGNVVFDVPPRHYKLFLTDENEQKTAYVDLPLAFSTGSSEMPLPGTQK